MMLLSERIAALQAAMALHGDIKVVRYDEEAGHAWTLTDAVCGFIHIGTNNTK